MQPTRRAVLAAGAALAARPARADTPVRAVIELFTSQGCSSCPPADRLLGELSRDPGLLTLSLPVDYWDSLGWKDTLARPEFTRRQRAYADMRGDGEVYTPQAVVSGGDIAVGSDRRGILSLAATPLPVTVTIDRNIVRVRGAPPDAVLVVVPFLRSRSVAIGRGENASAHVTYTNIARGLTVLSSLDSATEWRIPDPGDADGVAVLVQRGGLDRPGRILGAARS